MRIHKSILLSVLFVLFLSGWLCSCEMSDDAWLCELSREAVYYIEAEGVSGGGKICGFLYIEKAVPAEQANVNSSDSSDFSDSSDSQNSQRNYSFVYSLPETVAGLTVTREDGKTVFTLENFEKGGEPVRLELQQASDAATDIIVSLFSPSTIERIERVRTDGTYNEIYTEDCVYFIDKNGDLKEIKSQGISVYVTIIPDPNSA